MLEINLNSNVPIYEQIIQNIKENVVIGYLKPNDALPSVRKLATMLHINPNTAAKAYNELEKQGIIKTMVGKGTFISNRCSNEPLNIYDDLKSIKPVLTQLMLMGIKKEIIIENINKLLLELEGEK